ncbi:MAG: Ig-like domain-containing protein [Planctomycetota bacterium]
MNEHERIHKALRLEELEPRTAPAVLIDLVPGDDSGVSDSDNITNEQLPTFEITSSNGNLIIDFDGDGDFGGPSDYGPGDSLNVNQIGSPFFITPRAPLSDGFRIVTVWRNGQLEATLGLRIDTQAPDVSGVALDLAASSDSGVSNSDNLTNQETISLDIGGYAEYYRVYRNGVQVSGYFEDAPTFVTALPADGTYSFRIRAVDAAGNLSGWSLPLSVTLDTGAGGDGEAVPPPDLVPLSDTGLYNDDNITADKTSTFDITGIAPAHYFRIYLDGVLVSSLFEGPGNDPWTSDTLADGDYLIRVAEVDAAGNELALSDPLAFTVDTVAPDAPALPLDLRASSDTGASDSDDITADITPTFDAPVVPAGDYFRIYRDGALASAAPLAGDDGGVYKGPGPGPLGDTLGPQPDGTYDYAYSLVDLAGNESGLSPVVTVVITTDGGDGDGDGDGGEGGEGGPSDAPTIGGLSLAGGANVAIQPCPITLMAEDVSDLDGEVVRVDFYRDANGNGELDIGVDEFLASDTDGDDGWSWTGSTFGFPLGENTFFAQAEDDTGGLSSVVSATITVRSAQVEYLLGGQVILYDTDALSDAEIDVDETDIRLFTRRDGSVSMIRIVGNPTGLGMIVNSTSNLPITIVDIRNVRRVGEFNNLSFIASTGAVRVMLLRSGVDGWCAGGALVMEELAESADLDEDGRVDDETAIYSDKYIRVARIFGDIGGDVVTRGADLRGTGLGNLLVRFGDILGEITTIKGSLNSLGVLFGNVEGNVRVEGSLNKMFVNRGGVSSSAISVNGNLNGLVVVGGNFGSLLTVDGSLNKMVVLPIGGVGGALDGAELVVANNINTLIANEILPNSSISAGGVIRNLHTIKP